METTNNNAAGAYCHVNGVMYKKRKSDSQLDTTHPQGDCTHRHIDAGMHKLLAQTHRIFASKLADYPTESTGCWGLLGKRSLWFGKAPEDHVFKMMKRVIQRHRVIPGHEEAFLDVLIGKFTAQMLLLTHSSVIHLIASLFLRFCNNDNTDRQCTSCSKDLHHFKQSSYWVSTEE